MPTFLSQFASEVTNKKERFAACFDPAPGSEGEVTLKEAMRAIWNPLPSGPGAEPRKTFAVDGSSALRPLVNGASFLVCQSLLIGPDTETSMVAAEIVRGGDAADASRGLDRLRQFCEFSVAVENLDRMAGGMLLVDGSLLSDLSHMLYLRPMRLGGYTDLRDSLFRAYLDLIEGCRERDILLVGISKSARDSLLVGSLLENPRPSDRLCDAEILHRFLDGAPGFTRPILFGTDGTAASAPHSGADGPAPPDLAAGGDIRSEEASRIAVLPCVAVFYLRLAPGEDALRVDVTGDGIGCAHRLLDFRRAWGEVEMIAPVVRRLVAQHGGPSVYNGPLYTADRMVRLSGKTVDSVYMAILSEATGVMILSDRGTRRFL
jgi:hypothetical protein